MVSNISYGLICAINLLAIPVISLKIYGVRHKIQWGFNFDTIYWYCLLCVLNLPITRGLSVGVEKIALIKVHAESTKYTVLAIISAILIPYIIEVFQTYLHINVQIEDGRVNKKNNEEKE